MNRQLFQEANGIYFHIQLVEKQKAQLFTLMNQMNDLLKNGYPRIPEDELLDLTNKIKHISKYLDKDIEERWNRINEL